MILNISRVKEFNQCRQKMKYHHVDELEENSIAIPLMTGGAFHEGAAKYLATKDVKSAVQESETSYRKKLEGQMILPEERRSIEQQVELAKRMVDVFATHFNDTEMVVISPEVEFCIPLPNTEHHCYFFHKLLHPDIPFHECKMRSKTFNSEPRQVGHCWQPHYFRGKTDAVISWKGKIWLLEHKTTAMTGNIFYDKFMLDFQTTGYLYGIGKALGTRPHGFLLNVLKKPNKNAKDQLSVSFEREPYLRSDEDISRFESQFILQAQEYERAVTDNIIWMNPDSCTSWNRRCYFWDVCKNFGRVIPEQFKPKAADYVDLEYYKILSIEPPSTLQLAPPEEVTEI
jgi:hypothetical protein